MKIENSKIKLGFTLVEILVTLAIIGVLVSISAFAINQARISARNNRRKADLETIRAGLELYRSDCGSYPVAIGNQVPNPLVGDGSVGCPASNAYITDVPSDPEASSGKYYRYNRPATSTYELCANQEGFTTTVSCGGTACGTGADCHYKVTSP